LKFNADQSGVAANVRPALVQPHNQASKPTSIIGKTVVHEPWKGDCTDELF